MANGVMDSLQGDSKDQRIMMYDQESIRELGFCQEDFVLIALLAGGDYSAS